MPTAPSAGHRLEQLRGRPLRDRTPGLDPDQPVRHPPRLREVVGDEHERDLEPLAAARAASPRRAGRVSASSAEVGSSSSSTRRLERERPREHRPLLLADREPRAVARGERGSRPARSSSRSTSGSRPASSAAKRMLSVDGPLEQRGELGNQADLAAQRERVALAHVGAAVADGSRLGIGEPVEQPQHGRLARARGPGEAGRPGRDRGAELAQHRACPRARGGPRRARTACCDYRGDGRRRADAARRSSRCWRPPAKRLPPATTAGRSRSSGTACGRWPSSTAARLRICARRGEDTTGRYPELAAIGDGARGSRADPRRRGGRLRRARRAELSAAAAADGAHRRGDGSARRAAETPVTYVAFDLLWLDGRSLLDEPYERRRELLAELGFDGAALADAAPPPRRRRGAVGRRCASAGSRGSSPSGSARPTDRGGAAATGSRSEPPPPGARDRRLDARRGQPAGGRVGSLLVGHWDATPEEAARLGRPQRLVYAGGVGTGFTEAMLERADGDARRRSAASGARSSSAGPAGQVRAASPRARRRPVWVEPVLVCEVEFLRGRTRDTLRQSSFKGLRDDKDAREVVREAIAGR